MEFVLKSLNDLRGLQMAPEPFNAMLKSLIFVTAFYLSLVLIGLLMNGLENLLFVLVEKISNYSIAHFICNRLTFVGIMIHELSHALFVVLTGGKVTEIGLFDVFRGDRLGHVNFNLRGGSFRRSLQMTFTSCAPVIVLGAILMVLLFVLWPMASVWWHYVLLVYGIMCCVCHMSMSPQDASNCTKGLLYVYPLSWLIGFLVFWLLRPAG